MSLLDVAAALDSEPALAERDRADWLRQIEEGIMPASFNTIAALRSVFAFNLDFLAGLAVGELGLQLSPDICTLCGDVTLGPSVDRESKWLGIDMAPQSAADGLAA